MQLREYQETCVNAVSQKLAAGTRKVVLQLATGGGKTVIFSAIAERYTKRNDKSVLILVHRKELLQQTRRTLFNAFGISAQVIIAGMKTVPSASVYVGMVESTIRRIPTGIGLVIIDEAHIASFNKIHDYFPTQFIIGMTATPLSANKRQPMKLYYDDIVSGIQIAELIAQNSLCQNITFAAKDSVDRASLAIKGGEFEDGLMALQFSKAKHINNTVEIYRRKTNDTKAIIFNVNIDHSILVNDAFIAAGYPSRHLDSTMTATDRDEILKWFKETPNAILNNVGILTAGFDEPSIETVIFNKATMSMPLWLQCTGRGARPTPTKTMFTILDMGGNVTTHGDWSDHRDWEDIFFNPEKKSDKIGVSPSKDCPKCEAMIATRAMLCKYCGYIFPVPEPLPEEQLAEFINFTKGIDVAELIEQNKWRKEYFPFFNIGTQLASEARKKFAEMDEDAAEFILQQYYYLGKQWTKQTDRRFNQWHKERASEHLNNELQKHFKNYKPQSIL